MTQTTPKTVLFGLILTLTILVGCGDKSANYGDIELSSLSGTVTLDGEPLAGANMKFLNAEDESSFEYAVTDADGNYTARFDSQKEGISAGKKKVFISTGIPVFEDDGFGVEKVPTNYNTATTLEIEITSGSNSENFDLVSVGEIVQPEGGEEED